MAPDNTTWWLTADLANLSRVKCDCSLYCLSHTHWVITAIDAVALDNTSNVILLAAVTYLERERELTLLSFLKYGGFRQTPVSESSSCSSSPLLPAWYRWHVACGEPRCLFCPWELVQEWACGWQAIDRKSEGEGKEKLTMGTKHALLRSCFGAAYVIKNPFSVHISQWVTLEVVLWKRLENERTWHGFKKRTLLHLQQLHVQNRGNACGRVRCDTLWLNPHPCLRTARTETLCQHFKLSNSVFFRIQNTPKLALRSLNI